MKISSILENMGAAARTASARIALLSSEEKNRLLQSIADELERQKGPILAANAKDLELGRSEGLTGALLDRLSIQNRLEGIIYDVRTVALLPDPIGEILEERTLPNGLELMKKRVPIGVIGIIYEARPNVTVDVASLCLKTGNAAILRGGKEAMHTNKALAKAIQTALVRASLPKEAIQLIARQNRSQVKQLLKLHKYVDLIIPRGGAGLHQFCRENSTIPVITGGVGICHLYVDSTANLAKAIEVIDNAKTQRPTVCNALDTLLVEASTASRLLPPLAERLLGRGVSFRLDERAWGELRGLAEQHPDHFHLAKDADWDTEWLSLVLGIKIVDSLDEAINHISTHASGHSDGILTETKAHAAEFVSAVDSAAVYVNASTRFTDGGEFGLGAEVAVSTQKLHARGPMGLRELTTYKWIVTGNYHTRK